MREQQSLPHGWEVATLGDVGQWCGGGTPSKDKSDYWSGGKIPWVSPKDMKVFRIFDSEDHITQVATDETNVKQFAPGTVLIVIRSGILSRTLPVAVSEVPGTMNQDLKGITPHPGISPHYLAYYLAANERAILHKCSKDGTTVASIEIGQLRSCPLPVAPSDEQRRIIAKLEELLSDLDAGVTALERARANLKKYRAAVLKAAVTGELTADWRAAHPNVEPATKLLDRILTERRQKWEADQQAKYASSGKTPPKGWQDKYPKPAGPNDTDLTELPVGWCWAKLDQLISYLRNGYFQSPIPLDSGVKLLRINAVRPMRVDLSEFRYLPPSKELDDYVIENEDLLFTRYNGSLDLLGVAGLVRGCAEQVVHPDKLIRVKTVLPTPLPNYLEVACNTGESRRHMTSRARTTAGQTGISGGDVRDMPIPLPPLAEQEEIVAEVEQRLTVIAATDDYISASLNRAARLRQSILKEAFAGRLVSQDRSEEPASVLLARIREQRSEPVKPPRQRPERRTVRRREPKGIIFRRGAVASYVVKRLCKNPSFGRTQLVKALHLAQAHVGIDLSLEFERHQLGPLDKAIYKMEGFARKQGWFSGKDRERKGVTYQTGPNIDERCEAATVILGDKQESMDRLLTDLLPLDTNAAELFSTVYAAWNDLLIDGRPTDDADIVAEVYAWHESKKRFPRGDILARIAWMRENGYVPTGTGPRTQTLPNKDGGTAS